MLSAARLHVMFDLKMESHTKYQYYSDSYSERWIRDSGLLWIAGHIFEVFYPYFGKTM